VLLVFGAPCQHPLLAGREHGLIRDPHLDGTGLRFETMEHGGEYPDTMPQAIKLIDAEGRSCIYVPITQDGKVVDSYGFMFDPEG
jgi:hypothetical protein